MTSVILKRSLKIKIFVAAALEWWDSLVRSFNKNRKYKLITTTRKDLDLLSAKTFNFVKKNKPDLIIDAAAELEEFWLTILLEQNFYAKLTN